MEENNQDISFNTLKHEWTRSRRVERALRDVGIALGTTVELNALLQLILERTTDALQAERATLYLLEPLHVGSNERVLVSRVIEGAALKNIITLQLGEGLAGDVARTGVIANVRDAYEDKRFSRAWDERTGFRTRAVLCVPLKTQQGEIVGVIQVLNKLAGAAQTAAAVPDESLYYFDEDDEFVLTALAAQAVVSIEQARLVSSILEKNRELVIARTELEKKVEHQNVLFAIERATAHAMTRDELAFAILPEVARAVSASIAMIALADETGDLQVLYVKSDLENNDIEVSPPDSIAPVSCVGRASASKIPIAKCKIQKLRIKSGEDWIGRAITENNTIVVSDLALEPQRSTRIRDILFPHQEDAQAPSIATPIVDETDRSFGALIVVRKPHDREFTNDEVNLMRLLALNASTGFQLEVARTAQAIQDRLSTIGSLLSSIVHDLKTPMAVISGYVQMMVKTEDAALRQEHASLVLKQLEHISAMQREVLEFARGERRVFVRKVYLAQFFSEIEAQLRREIERQNIPFALTIDIRHRGVARFDPSKITRAIHNLARNAFEAMGTQSGELRVVVDVEHEDTLVISVADTGPGIASEVQERLFQSFVSVGKQQGTGLGLAIVKKIAEDHGGTISASSSHQGACFTLRIPQQPSTATRLI